RVAEEADDLVVRIGVGGHAVPGLRRKLRRAGLDQSVQPLRHPAIRLRHLRDRREHVAFAIALAGGFHLAHAILHRLPFFGGESLGYCTGIAHGGLARGFLCDWTHKKSSCVAAVRCSVRTERSREAAESKCGDCEGLRLRACCAAPSPNGLNLLRNFDNLTAAPARAADCRRDRAPRNHARRKAASSVPRRFPRRWPGCARTQHRDPAWPATSSRTCPWPSSRQWCVFRHP